MTSNDKISPKSGGDATVAAVLEGKKLGEMPPAVRASVEADDELKNLAAMVGTMDQLRGHATRLSKDEMDRTWERLATRFRRQEASTPSIVERLRVALGGRMTGRIAIAGAVVALVVAGYFYLAGEAPVATLLYAGGRVQAGQFLHYSGLQSQELTCHTPVETQEAGAIMRYKSGVQVMLAASTAAKVAENRDLELTRGSAWIEVEKGKGDFFVRTPDAVVRVTGTSFGVIRDSSGSRVVLAEGSVEVTAAGDPKKSAQLTAGQSVTVAAGASAVGTIEASADVPEWVGQLHSEATSASLDPLVPSVTGEPGGAKD